MKKTNKLVALLLAAVMVLGMLPTTTAHAHEHHTHAVEVNGIEEYPAIDADVETTVTFANAGDIAYLTFTPEKTDLYYFYSTANTDTKGYIYDAEMNQINYNDDSSYGYSLGIFSPNFCMAQVMEAGVTYVLAAQPYQSSWTGEFTVTVMTGHSYTSEVTKEATCDEDGVLTYTCTYCGSSYEEPIPAAHTYSEETGECIYCGEAYLVTGECGEALTWELDYFGKLTIKGTGEMYHYSHSWDNPYYAPWYDYLEDITALVVEEGVTTIGNYAFKDCQYITEASLPESLTALGAHAFDACYGITEIALSDAITVIPDSCFYYCGSLSEVKWPASLTEVQASAFYSCDLGDLVVPEGVTTIGQYAFGGNSRMAKLTLPTTLTTVENYGFSSMYYTKDFVFTGDAPTFGASAFSRVTANAWYPLGNATWTEDVLQNYGGTITWSGLCSGEHAYGDAVTIPATCTTGSYMTMTCTVCGYTTVSPEIEPALGHDLQYDHYDGGCGEYSYDIVECTRCDYYSTDNWVWVDHTYETTHVDATCEIGGYDLSICTECGYRSESNYTAPLGHDVAEWSEPTEATCTEPSVKTGTCARCEQTVSEKLADALGHEWDTENGVANDDGSMTYTCIRCGETYRTEGSVLYNGDNTFTVAASTGRTTKTYTAEQSGTLTITLNQMVYHNQTAWENGWSDQYWQSLGMQWVFSEGFFNVYINDQNTGYTVVNEGELVLNAVEVNAGDVVTVEVNHMESSYYYSNDVQFNMNLALESAEPETLELVLGDNTVEMPESATGEGPTGVWTAEQDGTLDINVSAVYYQDPVNMEFFGEEWTELPIDRAFNYGWFDLSVNGEAVDGNTASVEVKAGDQVMVKVGNYYGYLAKAIVNLSFAEPHTHSYTAVVTEPTCTEGGYTTYTCECGDTYTADETAALGHDYETVVTEPTCTEGGYTTYTCERCDDTYTADETAALGHEWKGTKCLNCDATRNNPFTDVPEDSFYIDPVLWAVENDITTGATETTFDPEGDCLRASVVTFLWRAAGEPEPTSDNNPFTDVSEKDFFYKAVLWAVEKGITNGTSATEFSPYMECNRAAVVTFLYRAMGEPEVTNTNNPFTDVDVDQFYGPAVLWAVENEITNGMGDGTFGITKTCNRAQVVTFLYRTYNN